MKKTIIATSIIVLAVLGVAYVSFAQNATVYTVHEPGGTSTSTPTRLDQVKAQIDAMTEEQKNDPKFISETQREENLLVQQRDVQAQLNALTVYKVEIQQEEYNLNIKLKNIGSQLTASSSDSLTY